LPGAGRPLFAIIATRLPPWISSLSRQSRSSCCTAFYYLPRAAADSARERNPPSHQHLDCATAKRSLSLRIRSQIPALRSRPKIWSGSTRCPSLPANHGRANLNPKPLTKRCCGTLGRQLPARSARPHHRPERAPPQAASRRVHVLLSRRPHPSWPPQGNSGPQNPFCSHRSGDLPCAIRRFAPSLRPRGLRSVDFHWLTRLGTSVGSSVINKEQSAPTQHLRPRTQPISCRDTLFMTIFEVHFELGRATGATGDFSIVA
jgi:hypothetical protein